MANLGERAASSGGGGEAARRRGGGEAAAVGAAAVAGAGAARARVSPGAGPAYKATSGRSPSRTRPAGRFVFFILRAEEK